GSDANDMGIIVGSSDDAGNMSPVTVLIAEIGLVEPSVEYDVQVRMRGVNPRIHHRHSHIRPAGVDDHSLLHIVNRGIESWAGRPDIAAQAADPRGHGLHAS